MSQTQFNDAIALIRAGHVMIGMGLAMIDGDAPLPGQMDGVKAAFAAMFGGSEPQPNSDPKPEQAQDEQQEPEDDNYIDPEWTKGKNRHLTPKGQRFLFALWQKKTIPNQAAFRMGIHWGPVDAWYKKFEAGLVP